jgi:hypothetical protein
VFGQSLGNGNAGYDPTIYKNQWTHIVVEYGGTGNPTYPWQIWINGVTDGYIWGGGGLNTSQPLIIGGRGSAAATVLTRAFKGSVDEVAFYKTNLSSAQILAHYNAAYFGVPPTFSVQPVSQNAFLGQSVTFTTTVGGAPGIGLQWRVNGTPIPGQTNSSLTLTNLYYTQSTNVYTVIATNKYGTAISSNAVVTVYYSPTYANLTNSLVLHLTFDGTYSDSSGHGNDAAPVNSPALVPGKIGSGALSVNTETNTAVYNYATLGTPADLTFGSDVDFSVSYWIQTTNGYAFGDLPVLCSTTNSYGGTGVTFAPSYRRGGWSWSIGNDVNSAGLYGTDNSINDGAWHNVVTVFTRSANAVTYLDGLPVSTTPIAGIGSVDSGLTWNIGQAATGTYMEEGGFLVDDLGVWRRALTDVEARSIYTVGQVFGKSFDTFGPVNVTLNQLANGKLVIAWQSGTLYQASTVNGPWTPVPGATLPYYTVTPSTTNNVFFSVGK